MAVIAWPIASFMNALNIPSDRCVEGVKLSLDGRFVEARIGHKNEPHTQDDSGYECRPTRVTGGLR